MASEMTFVDSGKGSMGRGGGGGTGKGRVVAA